MSAKVCPACQKKFFDGSVFCDNCGTQLVDEQPEAQPSVQPEYQPPVNQQPPVYAQQPVNQPPVYGQPYAQPAYAPVVMVKPNVPGRGFGIASMILGIIGIVYGFFALCVSVAFNDEFSKSYYDGYYSSKALNLSRAVSEWMTVVPFLYVRTVYFDVIAMSSVLLTEA